jgi:hypothetical protein
MRHIFGIIVATAAAPYITVALIFSFTSFAADATLGEALAGALWGGSLALLFVGIPILFVSTLLSAVVKHLGRHALLGSVLSGAMTGSGFMIFLFWNALPSSGGKLNVGCGAAAGAICGWIYWVIALRKRASDYSEELQQKA